MSSHLLQIHPAQVHSSRLGLSGFKIQADLSIHDQVLHLEYRWEGDAGDILWPALHSPASRRDLLWEHTCFEAFWAWEGEECYWELNVSPSGDWNIYSFETYRQGQKQEEKLGPLYFERHSSSLVVRVDLARIQESHRRKMRVGVTAVVELVGGKKTYWAVHHASAQPDFHLRKSFIIQI